MQIKKKIIKREDNIIIDNLKSIKVIISIIKFVVSFLLNNVYKRAKTFIYKMEYRMEIFIESSKKM